MKLNYILLNALVLGPTPLNTVGTGNGKFGKSESHPPHVLLEDGGCVLMEDGGKVILEEYGEG